MTETEKETLIRQYAAGQITWHDLRERGFDDYVQVLGALGELGLRPPIAAMEGPNRDARERGRAAGDQIPDAAAAQGRNVARQRKSLDSGVVRDRLRTQLQRDRDTPTS